MKENEIRPAKIFNRYLELSKQDASLFLNRSSPDEIDCIACNSDNKRFEFKKEGFSYFLCRDCETLFQSPRPSEEAFYIFYNESLSSEYWSKTFYPSVAEIRREKIIKPRVQKISKLCETKSDVLPKCIFDVGAGYGIFLEEWKNKFPSSDVFAIEPSKNLAKACREKNIKTINKTAEEASEDKDLLNRADLVVCFEVLEHVRDPLSFIKTLKSFLSHDGLLIITTLCSSGFDIQILWEKSNSISPPHHINFFSLDGFNILFERAGFKNIDIITPGVLDIDIVKNSMEENYLPNELDRFLKKILKNEKTKSDFQKFLIRNNLSSHSWVIAH